MDAQRKPNTTTVEPPEAPEFQWQRSVFWLAVCCVHGTGVAWVAVTVQEHFAPWLVFPLLVGIVLGTTGVGLLRVCQVGHRPTLLLGALLSALVAVCGQHYIGYRIAREVAQQEAETFQLARQFKAELLKGSAPMPAEGFVQFMRWQAARGRPIGSYTAQGLLAWLTWVLDGLLVLAASVAVVVPASRQPYCSRCRSWFRTTRSGRIDPQAADGLASPADVAIPDDLASVRYRLVTCAGGCGPTGFELCWENRGGKSSSARVWLDAAGRKRIVDTLDTETNR